MRPTLYGYAQFVFGEWQMCTLMYTSIDELNEVAQGHTDDLKLVEVKPGDPEYDELYKAFAL